MYGYVYKTTNLINGKIYIGRHKSKKFDKWYFGSGAKIRQALSEYGDENFAVEILYYCESEDELNEKEKEAIIAYESRDPEKGYNIDQGGTKGNWLDELSPEQAQAYRDKMSNLSRQGICGNKGKHFTEKHKKRIGESNKGKIRTEEWRLNQSKARKGKPAWNKGLTLEDDRVKKYARKKGEFKHTAETKARMSEKARNRDNSTYSRAVIGKIWISNGQQRKMIYPEHFEEYAKQGYVKGRGGWNAYGKSSSKI